MRTLTLLGLVGLGTSCFAQGLVNDGTLSAAFRGLQGSQTLFMRLQGTETTGGRNSAVNYDTYFQSTVDSKLRESTKVNIIGYRDNKPVTRICGDGTTLWCYDFAKNSYSADVYGSYSSVQPQNYTADLLRIVSGVADGYAAYPALVLSQVYSASGYQSWLPGYVPTLDAFGNVNYAASLTPNTSPYKTISFATAPDGIGGIMLTNIAYSEYKKVSTLVKQWNWTMAIQPGFIFDQANFTFVPPAGARAISRPHQSSG